MPLTDAFAVRFAVWLGLAWILARVVEGWLQDWTGWALVLGPPACLLAIGLGERPGARILLALCLVCVLALPESRLRLAGHAPRQALLLQEIGRESAPRQRQYRYLRLWLVDSLGHCVPSGRVLESHDMSEPRARESTLLLPPHAPGQAARLLARPPVNPGGFDEVGWLTRLSCEARLAASGLDQARAMAPDTGPPMLWQDRLENLRLAARHTVSMRIRRQLSPETGAFLVSLMLGDRSGLDRERLAGWRASGLAHLLALSGLHVGLLAGLLLQTLGLLRVPRLGREGALLCFLIGYVWLVGAPASVVRASSMAMLLLLARRLERGQPLLLVLLLCAEVQLLLQPGQLLQAGFLLSYLAVAALALGLGNGESTRHRPRARIRRLGRSLLLAARTSLTVTLFTAGVTLHFFGRLPLGGIALNLLAIPACGVVLSTGVLHTVVALPGNPLPALLETGVWFLDRLALLGADPRSHILWKPSGAVSLWLGVLPFIVLLMRGRLQRALIVCGISGCLLALGLKLRTLHRPESLELLALDVDQGDATLLLAPGGERVLVDAGVRSAHRDMGLRLLPVLAREAPEGLDWLVLTHPDADHIGGALSLLRNLPVRAVLYNGEWRRNALCDSLRMVCDSLGLSPRRARPGMQLARDPRWRLRVLGPPAGTLLPEGNERSVVLRVEHGLHAALLAGDAGLPAETWLLAWGPLLESQVLKLGHHGSRHSSSPAWLDAVSPELCLVSCGRRNRYGHPSPEVLQRCRDRGARILRSDHRAAIWLRFDRQGIRELNWPGRPAGPLFHSRHPQEEE